MRGLATGPPKPPDTEIAEGQRIAGDFPRDPRERHVLGAVSEHVEHQPEPVEPIVARPERGERRPPGRPRRSRHGARYYTLSVCGKLCDRAMFFAKEGIPW